MEIASSDGRFWPMICYHFHEWRPPRHAPGAWVNSYRGNYPLHPDVIRYVYEPYEALAVPLAIQLDREWHDLKMLSEYEEAEKIRYKMRGVK